MLTDGVPDPEFGLQVKLTGTTFDFNVDSDVIKSVTSGDSVASIKTSEIIAKSTISSDLSFTESGATAGYGFANAINGTVKGSGFNGANAQGIFDVPITGEIKIYSNTKATFDYGPGATADNTAAASSQSSVTIEGTNVFEFLLPGGTGATLGNIKVTSTPQILAISLNGKLLDANAELFELTFENNSNFNEFADGDVVQNAGEANEVKIDGTPDAVNNKITVDGGDWLTTAETTNQNRDQLWSSFATGTPLNGSYVVANGFDGDLNTVVSTTNDFALNLGLNPITGTTVSIYGQPNASLQEVLINGISVGNIPASTTGWVDFNVPGGAETITAIQINTGSNTSFSAIKVDSDTLVDEGLGGANVLKKEYNYSNKLTLNSSKDLSELNGKAVYMTNGLTPVSRTGYTLNTGAIENVSVSAPSGLDWTEGDGSKSFTDVDITAWLTSKNITSVAGFRMELYTGTRGSEIRSFNINGTDLKGSGLTASSTGSYYSTATPANWFSGSGSVVQNLNGESQFTFDAQPITGTVTVTVTSTNGYIYLIDGSGIEYPLLEPGAEETVLTFADPCPDLRYFKPEDQVQPTLETYSDFLDKEANSSNPKTNAFDGKSSTEYKAKTNGTITLNYTFKGVTSIKIRCRKAGFSNANTLTVSGTGISNKNITGSNLGNLVTLTTTSTTVSNISIATSSISGLGTGIAELQINGETLIDGSSSSFVQIIDTDVTNRKMAVDGGNWRGSDGTTAGNAGFGWNQDEIWSNNFDANTETTSAFDGKTSTQAGASSGTATFTTSIPNVKNIAVQIRRDSASSPRDTNVTINNTTTTLIPAANNNEIFALDLPSAEFTLTSLTFVDAPTVSVSVIEVNGQRLVDDGVAGNPGNTGSTTVELETNGGIGTVIKVDGNDAYITNTGDDLSRWIADDNAAGTDFYIAPQTPITESQTTAYGVVAQVNGQINVTGIQKNEPEFEPITSRNGVINFPAEFIGTGNPPDTDLPNGVSITATVQAENIVSDDEQDSNTLLPQALNPDGSVGPITASTETTITSANTANIDGLTASDKLMMVDSTGAKATYTLETSTISSVTTINSYADQATGITNPENAFDDNATTTAFVTTNGVDGVFNFNPPISGALSMGVRKSSRYSYTITHSGGNTTQWAAPYSNNTTGDRRLESVGTFTDITSISCPQSSGYSNEIDRIVIDGSSVVSQTFKELTFTGTLADNKDLKFFKSDDGVQSISASSVDPSLSDPYVPGQDWASYAVTANIGADKMFDGDVDTYGLFINGSAVWEAPEVIPAKTEVLMKWGSSTSAAGAKINDMPAGIGIGAGVYSSDPASLNYNATFAAAINSVGGLKKLQSTYTPGSQSQYVYWIQIDGKTLLSPSLVSSASVVSTGFANNQNTMTVDGGEWYADPNNGGDGSGNAGDSSYYQPAKEWSDYGTAVSASNGWDDWSNVFNKLDPSVAGGGGSGIATTSSEVIIWTPPANARPSGTNVTIWYTYTAAPGADQGLKVNGNLITTVNNNSTNSVDVAINGDLESVTLSGNTAKYLYGIIIDGKKLVNASEPGVASGETKVTFTPPSGTATFESAADEVLTVSGSNDRWISNDNRLGTDFYVKKDITRGLDADNPADVQIYQDIVDAFDAFPVKVNQRRTSIASSFYRLSSGEALSAAELQLLEETVTEAVNAQEPFALDGYYPLYYTTEKADAASETNSHHSHTIDGVEYYMPDGGTLYHGTYIS